jgi:hypothetical protein
MRKTLMDKEMNMLNGVGNAQEFWVDSIDIVKYLVNMPSLFALVDMTPHEVWSGKNPSLLYLKVSGCDSFVHVPKEKRNNMDKKEFKCIFIGYEEGMK